LRQTDRQIDKLQFQCKFCSRNVHCVDAREGLDISTFGGVRSLERGLNVLQAVNQQNGMKAADVAKSVGIPRPTAYRLLETLEALGFVIRASSDDVWRPTVTTRTLSSGFRDDYWVSQIAVPQMMKTARHVLWPLDLVVFRDFKMDIRESTHFLSPFSVDHGMVGRSLPVLDTAGGRAHLAFCDERERLQIMSGLEAETGISKPYYLQDGPLDYIIDKSRRLGLGYRIKGFNDKTMSISAPILRDGRPVACITLIWIASAMTFDQAIEYYRDPLSACAEAIAAELASPSDSSSDA
jgi:IclR family transcriptional regulator, mhp operon transcriptional activator